MKRFMQTGILLTLLALGVSTSALAQAKPPDGAPAIEFTLNSVSSLKVVIWGTGNYWTEETPGKFNSGVLSGAFKDAKPIDIPVANGKVTLYGKIEGLICQGSEKIRPIKSIAFKGEQHPLEVLKCQLNVLTKLDLHTLSKLKSVDCSNNRIDSLAVSGLKALDTLLCVGTKLKTLDIHESSQLRVLDISHNHFTSFDFKGLSNLDRLNCSHNDFKKLDLTPLAKLKSLTCQTNPSLKTLDFSCNPEITDIACYGVGLNTEAWNALYCTLPERSAKSGEGCIVMTPNASTPLTNVMLESDARLSTNKHWKITDGEGNTLNTEGEASCKSAYLFTSSTDLQVEVGQSLNLDIDLLPATIGRENLLFTSKDLAIAKVENSVVTGVANGTTTIEVDVKNTRAHLTLKLTVTGSAPKPGTGDTGSGTGSGSSAGSSEDKPNTGTDKPGKNTAVDAVSREVMITPMPFGNQLQVLASDVASVSIYNLMGDEVAREMNSDGLMNTSDLPVGMYVVVVYFVDGTVAQRMVVKDK